MNWSATRATLLLLPLSLLTLLQFSRIGAAISWQQVKPMYLVSTAHQFESALREPHVLSLESPPVLADEQLPGGAHAMDRIFGGKVAPRHCFPYQAGLLLQRPKGLYWCGGSLISNEFVLTAAHCVDMAKRGIVFLGAHEIKNANEPGQLRIMVRRRHFIIYPTWNPRRLKDDIALVRLPHAVHFNDRIHPIALPRRSYEYYSFRDKLAIASGWGRYAMGAHAISAVLRFVKLRIIDGRTCKRNFPLSYRRTNICTSGKLSRSTCNGDSGGPLVVRRRYTKKRILIGITSFGSIYGCDRGYPAAFTKVAAYLDWISDEAGIEPLQQSSSNTIIFHKYLKDYQNKFRRHTNWANSDEDFDDDVDGDVDTIDGGVGVGAAEQFAYEYSGTTVPTTHTFWKPTSDAVIDDTDFALKPIDYSTLYYY